MQCPKCSRDITGVNINIQALIAKCDACGHVFTFSPAMVATPTSAVPTQSAPRPENMHIQDHFGDQRISWTWFTPMAFFLLFFFIAWDAFLVFWYSIAFGENDMPWIMKVFPIGHLAIGVIGSYYTLALFVNRTTVLVSDQDLRVIHGPLPMFASKRLDRSTIRQLYVMQRLTANRNRPLGFWTYELHALRDGGDSVLLLRGLEAPQARYLEEQIERWLGIAPAAVPGEWR